jgi:predicted peptidase
MLLAFPSFLVIAQENPQSAGSFTGMIQRPVESEYLLYLPDDYNDKPLKNWPMLVFLHGSGERGHDLEKVKVHGPPKLIELGKKFPFVVLSPQCPDSVDWDTETLYALIKHIVSEYRIDETMIWVTGLSMGGWATWDLAMAYPEYFAAIAPVCGRVNRNYPLRAADLKSLPVWVFHGAADDVVLIREQAKMVKALKACGNEARFTIYPLSGHDSWTETYDNPELYEWFLKQKRK